MKKLKVTAKRFAIAGLCVGLSVSVDIDRASAAAARAGFLPSQLGRLRSTSLQIPPSEVTTTPPSSPGQTGSSSFASPAEPETAVVSVLPGTTATVRYVETFSGSFYNAEKRAFEADISLSGAQGGRYEVTFKKNGAAPVVYDEGIAGDTFDKQPRDLEPLSAILTLASSQATSGNVLQSVSQTAQTSIPLALARHHNPDGTETLTGIGSTNGTLDFGPVTVPYVLTARIAAQFGPSGLVRADAAYQENLGTGDTAQLLSWTWSLAPPQ